MKTTRSAFLLILLVSSGAATGCDRHTQSWVGEVTTISPRLCVGRSEAAGTCFIVRDSQTLKKVHIGECVRVRFTPPQDGVGPSSLKAIKPVDPEWHLADCSTHLR
jgi:hypothetical protein